MTATVLIAVYLFGVAFIFAAAFSYRSLSEWGYGKELLYLIAVVLLWPVVVLLKTGYVVYERLMR